MYICKYNYLCLNNSNKKTVYLYIHCDNENQKELLISMIFIKDRAPPTVVKIALKNHYHSPVTIAVVIVAATFAITSTGMAILNDN